MSGKYGMSRGWWVTVTANRMMDRFFVRQLDAEKYARAKHDWGWACAIYRRECSESRPPIWMKHLEFAGAQLVSNGVQFGPTK